MNTETPAAGITVLGFAILTLIGLSWMIWFSLTKTGIADVSYLYVLSAVVAVRILWEGIRRFIRGKSVSLGE